ncbi:hypothetical protein PR048_025365 [Dryococelus australis]|uniref:RING-type domain-containing protein n=1 Tax=Dryococelus australis TaxID=614101 RepID=A0ABQ9GR53_9NEOP|nr:hypothetical protein PR048_025365 [Dryococelus australis]
MNKLRRKLKSVLECPVCFCVMKFKIRQCENGHSICQKCCRRVTKCPVCRGKLIATRNICLERISRSFLRLPRTLRQPPVIRGKSLMMPKVKFSLRYSSQGYSNVQTCQRLVLRIVCSWVSVGKQCARAQRWIEHSILMIVHGALSQIEQSETWYVRARSFAQMTMLPPAGSKLPGLTHSQIDAPFAKQHSYMYRDKSTYRYAKNFVYQLREVGKCTLSFLPPRQNFVIIFDFALLEISIHLSIWHARNLIDLPLVVHMITLDYSNLSLYPLSPPKTKPNTRTSTTNRGAAIPPRHIERMGRSSSGHAAGNTARITADINFTYSHMHMSGTNCYYVSHNLASEFRKSPVAARGYRRFV